MERYQCTLDSETLSKAVAELQEPRSNEKRLAIIDSLRDRFKSENPGLRLEKEDDFFILQFLRADKFDIPNALARLKHYHTKIQAHPELFQKAKDPKSLESLFNTGIVCPLEGKAKDGSTILFTRMGLVKCPLSDVLCLVFVTLKNLIIKDEVNQIYGFTIIHDTKLLTLSMAKQFESDESRKMLQIGYKSMPIRIKALHIINESKIVDAIYKMLISFVDKKVRKVTFMHGKNFSKLYDMIDKTVLPIFVGGRGPVPNPSLWKTKVLK